MTEPIRTPTEPWSYKDWADAVGQMFDSAKRSSKDLQEFLLTDSTGIAAVYRDNQQQWLVIRLEPWEGGPTKFRLLSVKDGFSPQWYVKEGSIKNPEMEPAEYIKKLSSKGSLVASGETKLRSDFLKSLKGLFN